MSRYFVESDTHLGQATELLRHAMKDQQITQAELAERLGNSSAYICQILSGRYNISLEVFQKFTDALDLDVSFVWSYRR
jgi:transcriptional regulator with XRE-family HTH domain